MNGASSLMVDTRMTEYTSLSWRTILATATRCSDTENPSRGSSCTGQLAAAGNRRGSAQGSGVRWVMAGTRKESDLPGRWSGPLCARLAAAEPGIELTGHGLVEAGQLLEQRRHHFAQLQRVEVALQQRKQLRATTEEQ